jgi:hypothetical protein
MRIVILHDLTTETSPAALSYRRQVCENVKHACRRQTGCRKIAVSPSNSIENRPLVFSLDQESNVPATLECWVGQCDARIKLRTNDCCNPTISFSEYR